MRACVACVKPAVACLVYDIEPYEGGDQQHGSRGETDEHGYEHAVVGGSAADGQVGGKEIRVLGHGPSPQHGTYRQGRGDPAEYETPLVYERQSGGAGHSRDDHERESAMQHAVIQAAGVLVEPHQT